MFSRSIYLSACILALCVSSLKGQGLGDYTPNVQKYALNKIKEDHKRIHIATFNINYQVYNARTEFKKGGSMLGGGNRGDATAKLAIALAGVSEDNLSKLTEKLYTDFTSQLLGAGYTLIPVEEAAKAEAYKDWIQVEGGEVKRSPMAGLISASPKGFTYLVASEAAASKKKGNFAAVAAQGRFGSLSKQLGDAIIAEIDLTVLFAEEGNTWQIAGAKIQMKPNLRLIDNYTIQNDKQKKGIISLKGAQTFDNVSSRVAFHHGKMGMGVTSAYVGTLKKPLEIEGVVDETKIVSFTKQSIDTVGASNAFYTVYSDEARTTEDIKTLEIDSEKYAAGVYAACHKMLTEHTKGFIDSLQGLH